MRWLTFFVITAIVLAGACNQAEAPAKPNMTVKPYFDIKGYFDKQIARLNSQQPKATKKVSLEGKVEAMQPDTLDYAQELRVFSDADINKPAWLDKYAIDSLKNTDGRLQTLRYTAKAEDLKVRLIEIGFSQDTLVRVYILNRLNTAVADADQELEFLPGKGYRLGAKQKVVYADAKNIGVEVSWR